ncbi:hypothetical protein FD755_012239, partial [Muntiacus reevesi]
AEKRESSGKKVTLPIVNCVHTNLRRNSRQPYAVSELAGHQTHAESWGTGRAVARIPRVRGGGTHRSGASGNMCLGAHMFTPTWKHWHHKVEGSKKTKEAVLLLKKLKQMRAGKGKMRNRCHIQHRGPCLNYNKDNGIIKLNVLELAPGDHVGRFCIWTKSNLPGHKTLNTDLSGILRTAALEVKSDEKGVPGKKPAKLKKPLVGKKTAGTKKPEAEKKPIEKKPTTEEEMASA